MENIFIKLVPKNRNNQPVTLQLHASYNYDSVIDFLNDQENVVYNDIEYTLLIGGLNEYIVSNFKLRLNDEYIACNYIHDTGEIELSPEISDRCLFWDCFGFIYFRIEFTTTEKIILDTNYIQVMVRKSNKYDSVRRMVDYVYRKNASFLYGEKQTPLEQQGEESVRKTPEAKLLVLKKIAVVYEENYRYFKANSRFTTVPKEQIDHFEKLQFLTSSSLQYIARHPEELHRVPSNNGIPFGKNYYQPDKTVILRNQQSFDIYENRVLVSFLSELCTALKQIEAEINVLAGKIPVNPLEKNDYITSTYFIYADTINNLNSIRTELKELWGKFRSLLIAYTALFQINVVPLKNLPRFTPIFRSIPQYHQIYDCMIAWFDDPTFSMTTENHILSVIKISDLYELYVLTKILNYFYNNGYEFKEANHVEYTFLSKSYYRETRCRNYFAFKKDNLELTVYYQPVIYKEDRRNICGLGLYRKTSLSFRNIQVEDQDLSGSYYTPDYIIKYHLDNNDQGDSYLIADAKFKRLDKVQKVDIPELAFKYLFSVDTITPEDKIIELCVFNGISDFTNDGVTNVFDTSIKPKEELPYTEVVTLTENSLDNRRLHSLLLRGTIGRISVDGKIDYEKLPRPGNNVLYPSEEQNTTYSSYSALGNKTSQQAQSLVKHENTTKVQNYSSSSINVQHSRKAKKQDKMETSLDLLELPKDISSLLSSKGYTNVRDVVPNCLKNDLYAISELNRTQRRKITGILKDKGIILN